MRYVKSNKAQSIAGHKMQPGEMARTTYAHARALYEQGLVSYATPAEVKAVAEAKAKRNKAASK